MTEAVAAIVQSVRERVLREGVDFDGDPDLSDRFVSEELRNYSERALGGSLPVISDERAATREIIAELRGFGALQPFLDDPEVEEIWINAPDAVFVARNGVSERTTVRFTEVEVRDLIERMLQSSGRRVDLSQPFVDASLPDGSRLHVVIADVTLKHSAVNIRKFARKVRDLHTLVALGTLTQHSAEFLRMCVLSGQNILVSGATQSGKTTLLNALLASARPEERIITVEETFELDLVARDSVAMQCRGPSLEGTGEINLRRLIKEALRMRPDRLVVGEVREAEALDLLISLNSGLPGMCSVHANSAREALVKLCTLPLLAGRNIDPAFVVPTVASSVDIVIHLALARNGQRHVTEILALTGASSRTEVVATSIFVADGGLLEATGNYPAKREKFSSGNFDVVSLLDWAG